MNEKAYIGINEDFCWTLYWGDGREDERYVLAIGREFIRNGEAIRAALDELQQWAWENGYVLDAPLYSKTQIRLEDLIEPEYYESVMNEVDDWFLND